MINIYRNHFTYKNIGNDVSLNSIKGDAIDSHILKDATPFLQGDGQLMAISCTPPTSEVRTAACVSPALTCKVTAEIFFCLTLGQILALGNLSEDQHYVIERCLDAECHEEELDEYLKDSVFIVFPWLESFWFNGSIIRR